MSLRASSRSVWRRGVVGEADLDGGGAHQVHRGGRDDLDGRHVGDVAGRRRCSALLLFPSRLATGIRRRLRCREVVALVPNRVHVPLSARLWRAPERSAPESKEDHIPPALAVPGYRVTHSASSACGRGSPVGDQGAEPALTRRAGWTVPLPPVTHPVSRWPTSRTKEEFRISDPRTNDRIRVPEVRLVGPAGEQVGVVRIEVALRLAQEADLDLVEVAPDSKPPVVKIMDYGKFKYEAAQKAKEARRNQANTVLKEVRFRLKIEAHDYTTKLKRAEGFLQSGDKVKAMILFRGREQSRPEQGVRLLRKFAEDVAEFGTVESNPTIDGRNMVMVIAPHKNKSEVKTEQNAQRAANKEAARSARTGTAGDDRDRRRRRGTRRIGPTDSRTAGHRLPPRGT